MDAGIIAKLKGFLRKMYGSMVVCSVQEQIKKGVLPEHVKVPMDVTSCKQNLFEWLSQSVYELNKDKLGVAQCWESTGLLRAWERSVQLEATAKFNELFPNATKHDQIQIDLSGSEDMEAGYTGLGISEVENEEEWVDWVDWGDHWAAQDEVATAGAGGSGS